MSGAVAMTEATNAAGEWRREERSPKPPSLSGRVACLQAAGLVVMSSME